MFRRLAALLSVALVAVLLGGCFGQSKATGKYKNEDKPKPLDGAK